jgi:hypothetical protein
MVLVEQAKGTLNLGFVPVLVKSLFRWSWLVCTRRFLFAQLEVKSREFEVNLFGRDRGLETSFGVEIECNNADSLRARHSNGLVCGIDVVYQLTRRAYLCNA